MLTAANKATKQAQEIIATARGGLLVSQEECRVYRLTVSGTAATGPCRLVGAVICASMEGGTATFACGTETILRLGAPAGCSNAAMFPMALSCADDLEVTLAGIGAEAYLYVADPS